MCFTRRLLLHRIDRDLWIDFSFHIHVDFFEKQTHDLKRLSNLLRLHLRNHSQVIPLCLEILYLLRPRWLSLIPFILFLIFNSCSVKKTHHKWNQPEQASFFARNFIIELSINHRKNSEMMTYHSAEL